MTAMATPDPRRHPQRKGCDAVADHNGSTLVCHLGPHGDDVWHHDMTDGVEWRIESKARVRWASNRQPQPARTDYDDDPPAGDDGSAP